MACSLFVLAAIWFCQITSAKPAPTDATGSANQWTYGYDNLDRLKAAENAATSGLAASTKLGWSFDATGNRLTEARGTPAVTTSYTIDSASNKLAQVGTAARTYDLVGNTLADGQIASVYSARNRLVQTTKKIAHKDTRL